MPRAPPASRPVHGDRSVYRELLGAVLFVVLDVVEELPGLLRGPLIDTPEKICRGWGRHSSVGVCSLLLVPGETMSSKRGR
jgi:hypothetical protein